MAHALIDNIMGSIERNTICSFLINGVARQGRFYKCRYTPADPPDPEEAYCMFSDNNNLIYVEGEELNSIQKVPNVAAAAPAAGKRRKSRKQRKRRLHKTSRK